MVSTESVSNDRRGYMIKCGFADKTLWLIYTNKGFGRGGEIHPVPQRNCVISGVVEFSLRFPDGTEYKRTVTEGHMIRVPEEVAHVAIAKTDSVMVEWHDGELPPFKDKKIYEPYRKRIWGEKK